MSFAAAVEGAADPKLGLTTTFAEPARRARERNCAIAPVPHQLSPQPGNAVSASLDKT
jgi:hypothetical protein